MKYYEMPLSVWSQPREEIRLACGCEFTKKELEWMWENGVRYIVKQKSLFEICYSRNYEPHFYSHKIFTFPVPHTDRGRSWYLTAEECNFSYIKEGMPELLTDSKTK